jgi:hypothetical protein
MIVAGFSGFSSSGKVPTRSFASAGSAGLRAGRATLWTSPFLALRSDHSFVASPEGSCP